MENALPLITWIVLMSCWFAWGYPFIFRAPHNQKRPSITLAGPTRAGLVLECLAIFIAFACRMPESELPGPGRLGPVTVARLLVVEPEPDRTDLLPRSSAKRASNAGRRAYTIRDFDTSEAGPCRDAPSSPTGGYRYTGEEAPGRAGSL